MTRFLLLALAIAMAPHLPAAEGTGTSPSADTGTAADDGIAPPPRGSVWRQTGPDGRVIFTDTPPPGAAEPVPMPKINQVPAFRPANDDPGTDATARPAFAGYQSVHVTGVEPGTTLIHPQEPVSIMVKVIPGLQRGHQLVILHDGVPANADNSPALTIADIPRGEHTFTAEIRDATGKVLATGEPLRFSVTRPSTLNRNRR